MNDWDYPTTRTWNDGLHDVDVSLDAYRIAASVYLNEISPPALGHRSVESSAARLVFDITLMRSSSQSQQTFYRRVVQPCRTSRSQ